MAVIDQTRPPHEFLIRRLTTLGEVADAVEAMVVRGAPWIGATAAHGMAPALRADSSDRSVAAAFRRIPATRPTTVNLRRTLDEEVRALEPLQSAGASGRRVGNRITSRIESTPASSIARRSTPIPRPPVGGIPYSSAST